MFRSSPWAHSGTFWAGDRLISPRSAHGLDLGLEFGHVAFRRRVLGGGLATGKGCTLTLPGTPA